MGRGGGVAGAEAVPVLQEAEGRGLWGDGKAGRVAGPKPVTLLEQLHW